MCLHLNNVILDILCLETIDEMGWDGHGEIIFDHRGFVRDKTIKQTLTVSLKCWMAEDIL